MSQLHLEVLTPQRVALEVETDSVGVQGILGRLGILPDHTAFVSTLDFGTLEYQEGTGEKQILCGTGFVEVVENRVSVLVRSVEAVEEIDVDRAKSALDRAQSRLDSDDNNVDMERAKAALFRALDRLRFAKAM